MEDNSLKYEIVLKPGRTGEILVPCHLTNHISDVANRIKREYPQTHFDQPILNYEILPKHYRVGEDGRLRVIINTPALVHLREELKKSTITITQRRKV